MERNTPVIVGVGQFCGLKSEAPGNGSPVDLASHAATLALADARAESLERLRQQVDLVAFVKLFSDSAPHLRSPFGGSKKPARSVAHRLGLESARALYTEVGGNIPQKLVNRLCGEVSRGELRAALIVGAEALRTTSDAARSGKVLDWNEDPPGAMEDEGFGSLFVTMPELFHGIGPPVSTYPLFEHAIRGRRGSTVARHLRSMGELMAPFSRVAARNLHAMFPIERTAEELATVNEGNRWVGHPYPRLMNAQDKVDQSAAVLITSVAVARELGIDLARGVYLHGHADVSEKLTFLERVDYARPTAIRLGAMAALEMAGTSVPDLDFFDIYSCFPSAVTAGHEALGLDPADPRGLTVTGGLPFFGGPGNNYTLHAIAEMVLRLRAKPGSSGFVWGNGGHLTKHSFGIYSMRAPDVPWQEAPNAALQSAVNAEQSPPIDAHPSGAARIETYTVVHGKEGPASGIVIGRLADGGARFVANTPPDRRDILQWMVDNDALGVDGVVSSTHGRNQFIPNAVGGMGS
jgi:acetyl-CoA C-acetyltransferase